MKRYPPNDASEIREIEQFACCMPRSTDPSRHDPHGHKCMMYVLPWCGDTKRVNTRHTYPIVYASTPSSSIPPSCIHNASNPSPLLASNTPTLRPSESRFPHLLKMLEALLPKKVLESLFFFISYFSKKHYLCSENRGGKYKLHALAVIVSLVSTAHPSCAPAISASHQRK